MTPPRVRPGETLAIPDEDYKFGVGTLLLRVSQVAPIRPESEWVGVRGVEVRPDGHELCEREVLVRVAALRSAILRPGLREGE